MSNHGQEENACRPKILDVPLYISQGGIDNARSKAASLGCGKVVIQVKKCKIARFSSPQKAAEMAEQSHVRSIANVYSLDRAAPRPALSPLHRRAFKLYSTGRALWRSRVRRGSR